MIIDLPGTDSARVNRALVDLRETGGSVTLGRVLTLVVVTDEGAVEEPVAAANAASYEHPCRVVAVARGERRGAPRMDAQIRVGGDAGASEVIVLRLYGPLAEHGESVVVPLLLPDAPVVAWWPGESPAVPAEDPIGRLAQRRITDVGDDPRPREALRRRAAAYRPGDTDVAWTRLTAWRGQLAAALDQHPRADVESVTVAAAPDAPTGDLLAGWLALRLGCPARRIDDGDPGSGLHFVRMERADGVIELSRPGRDTARLTAPGQPVRELVLARRALSECIGEELRRLDPDEAYAEVLQRGVPLVDPGAAAPETI